MENVKKRRIDRRSLYTKQAIKKAFLQLKEKKEYNSITISDICKSAEIGRSTFYLHYNHIAEVLDEVLDDVSANIRGLIEQLSDSEGDKTSQCLYPFCKFIRENSDYRGVFFDDALTSQIIKKLSGLYMEYFIAEMQEHTKLTRIQLKALFYFQINGCFAVSKQFAASDETTWCPIQQMIDQFIKNGFSGFSEHFSMFCATDKK